MADAEPLECSRPAVTVSSVVFVASATIAPATGWPSGVTILPRKSGSRSSRIASSASRPFFRFTTAGRYPSAQKRTCVASHSRCPSIANGPPRICLTVCCCQIESVRSAGRRMNE